ncbi:MAG: formate dehydrogenase accessory sulfurtransferase FdhD [Alphaproteobacteria bacterium]|nr:formate dehydrogenase accessory sulfurtransferase FdhD [Alphaproteobacteria bacterium]
MDKGYARVTAFRLGDASAAGSDCAVIVEDALTIDVEGVGAYTLMWTPTEPRRAAAAYTALDGLLGGGAEALRLAIGFVFTEGLIEGLDDLRHAAFCPDDPGVVRIVLREPGRAKVRRRDVVVTSSCGVCGGRDAALALEGGLPEARDGLTADGPMLAALMSEMERRQTVFGATGGAHACALFGPGGAMLAAAEDLGRHNALDKVIGHGLLQGVAMGDCGAVLSSRLSVEMVAKAARAGLQIVAAVSAPTSLAIELAARRRITLLGFVRDGGGTVYTCPWRVLG